MPSFNSELTISDSIKSVLDQTYLNWELLIVDDSSSDNSPSIVADFKDVRIIFHRNRFQKGAAGARKTAIESAQGRYIAFLDSDDIWHEDKLSAQIKYMKNNNYSFTYTDYVTFKDKVSNIKKRMISPDIIRYSSLIKKCNIGCLTVMLDRTKFSDFSFENHVKEDYAFWLKLLKQTDKAIKLPGCYAFYRLSASSLSGDKFGELSKQWHIVKNVENISYLKSIICIFSYGINGLIKHYLFKRKSS